MTGLSSSQSAQLDCQSSPLKSHPFTAHHRAILTDAFCAAPKSRSCSPCRRQSRSPSAPQRRAGRRRPMACTARSMGMGPQAVEVIVVVQLGHHVGDKAAWIPMLPSSVATIDRARPALRIPLGKKTSLPVLPKPRHGRYPLALLHQPLAQAVQGRHAHAAADQQGCVPRPLPWSKPLPSPVSRSSSAAGRHGRPSAGCPGPRPCRSRSWSGHPSRRC